MTALPTSNPSFANEFAAALRNRRLWTYLAKREITQQYDRTALGIAWIPLNVLIHVGTLGILFSVVMEGGKDFIAYFACSYAIWTVLARSLGEASTLWRQSARYLLHFPTPASTFLIKTVCKLGIVFCLSGPAGLAVALFVGANPFPAIAVIPAALALFLLNLAWMVTILSILCARFPDIAKFVPNLVFLLYLSTPILWTTDRLGEHQWIAHANPLYHLIQILRQPMLGQWPDTVSLAVAAALAAAGLAVAAALFALTRRRIPLWL